jgi:uncharacterized membrane protein
MQMERRASNRWTVTILLLAMVAVAICELVLISHREIELDESHTALLSNLPLRDMWAFVTGDVHPPLYFLLQNAWVRVFGDSAVALRLPSVFAHMAGTVVVFLLGRRLWSPRQALFAAVLFLFNPALVYYASEARGYMLGVFLVTATALCMVVWEQTDPAGGRWKPLAGAIVFGASAIYAHYVGLFVVAALFGVWFLNALAKRRGAATIFGAGILLCLLLGPWIPVLLRQERTRQGFRSAILLARRTPGTLAFAAPPADPPSALRRRAVSAAEDLASIAGVYPARRIGLALAALPILLLGAIGAFSSTRQSWLAAACVAVVLMNVAGILALSIELRRYLLLSTPFILLLLAFGAATAATSRRSAMPAAAAMLALLLLNIAGIVHVLRSQRTSATEESALAVARVAKDSDLVVFANAYAQIPFDYYAHRNGLHAREDGFPLAIRSWWAAQPIKGWGSRVATPQELDDYVMARRTTVGTNALWLVLYEDFQYDASLRVPKAFVAGARRVEDYGHCGKGPAAVCTDSAWQVYRIEY